MRTFPCRLWRRRPHGSRRSCLAARRKIGNGQMLGEQSFDTDSSGYAHLLEWCMTFGDVTAVGIEGSGPYGAGLSRHLRAAGITVHEVMSPMRQARRRHGKLDSVDAEAAARMVLAGHDLITPKSADGDVETMRALRRTRRSGESCWSGCDGTQLSAATSTIGCHKVRRNVKRSDVSSATSPETSTRV